MATVKKKPASRKVYPRKLKNGNTIIPGKSVGRHTVTVNGVERAITPKKKKASPSLLGTGAAEKAGRALKSTTRKRLKQSGAN